MSNVKKSSTLLTLTFPLLRNGPLPLPQAGEGNKALALVTAIYLILGLFISHPAHAQGYYNESNEPDAAAATDDNSDAGSAQEPQHMIVVTSIEKCYAQLGHAEAFDIEQHFTKPYEECQRRLALKLKQQHELKAGQKKNTAPPSGGSLQVTPAPAQTSAPPAPAYQAPPANTAPDNSAPAAPLSDEGLYFRVQKNALPASPPADSGQ